MGGLEAVTVVIAMWTGAAVLVLTLGLFAVVLGMRFAHEHALRRSERLTRRWRELLARAIVDEPTTVPEVSRRDAAEIMSLWSYYHEFLRGECRVGLNRLGHLAGLDTHAERGLRSDRVRHRLLSIHVLGNLRDRKTLPLLRPLAGSANPYLSLAATHALMRISPSESIADLIPMIVERPDWPPARVMAILQEAGPEVVSEPLAHAVVEADAADQPLLLIYLSAADDRTALRAIKEVLLAAAEERVIFKALAQITKIAHPDGLHVVRVFLEHPNWLIQLHAVQGIGRMGNDDDIDSLVRMLRHKQYWIRLRAAEALAKLPTMTAQRLATIRDLQDDRYARDILQEIIAQEAA